MNALPPCTRREALGRLATLLAAGLWPGAIRAATEERKFAEFVFVAANDFHHFEPDCDPWFEALFRQIADHEGVSFCFGLGDLAHKGSPESIAAVDRIARAAGLRFYATPGNHDNEIEGNTAIYERVLPGRLNYRFEHQGWQFVVIDSTEGTKWKLTQVQPATLAWLDEELPKIDPLQPLVLCTHFPLADSAPLCAVNAEDVLARFERHNLQLAMSGHHHGRTEVAHGKAVLVTNACCSRVANNHDGTSKKGYWLCRAQANGTIRREFVKFARDVDGVPLA